MSVRGAEVWRGETRESRCVLQKCGARRLGTGVEEES